MESGLLQKLADKKISRQILCEAAEADFSLIPDLIAGVFSPKPSVRYSCASALVDLSAKYPDKLYPYMNNLIAFLDNKYRILTWNAIAILANLCCVDKDKRFDAIFPEYFGFLKNEYFVTVANVVSNSGKIALAKLYLIPKITVELLKTENMPTTPYLTKECKLVVAEKVIEAFSQFYNKMDPEDKVSALSFVKRQQISSRKPLRDKAELFLKLCGY